MYHSVTDISKVDYIQTTETKRNGYKIRNRIEFIEINKVDHSFLILTVSRSVLIVFMGYFVGWVFYGDGFSFQF